MKRKRGITNESTDNCKHQHYGAGGGQQRAGSYGFPQGGGCVRQGS